jgi:hypothetical protein
LLGSTGSSTGSSVGAGWIGSRVTTAGRAAWVGRGCGVGSGVEVAGTLTGSSDATSTGASRWTTVGTAVARTGVDRSNTKISVNGIGKMFWTSSRAGSMACSTTSRAGVTMTAPTSPTPARPAAPTYVITAI